MRTLADAQWVPVLLLSEDVAVLAMVMMFALALVVIVMLGVLLGGRRAEPPPSIVLPAQPAALPIRASRPMPSRANPSRLERMEIDVPTKHVDAVITALRGVGWGVHETGEVVATDDDEEALTTLSVELPLEHPSIGSPAGSGEEIR